MFGPRFLYGVMPLFVLLVARAPALVAARVGGTTARAMVLVLPLCLAYAWFVPGARFSLLASIVRQRATPENARTSPDEVVRIAGAHHALVFVPVSWTGRLFARLEALELGRLNSEQIEGFADACDLQLALDREDSLGGSAETRLARIVGATNAAEGAPRIATPTGFARLRRTDSLPPVCASEFQSDSVHSTAFEAFLPLFEFDARGLVRGDIIYARDLGAALNERLRARFGDRTWYLFRRVDSPGGGILLPYPAPPTGTGTANSP